ncbi:hypothetical protein [Alkalicoccus luteus]|uniref:hypothetical protein n=1 Tax=Alkalicoccus luteus TaxID=1237094 RepID=UPI0040339B42
MEMPEKVYKFMKPKYLNSLRETGDIRVNFLKNFEETNHGSEIGDDFEGITKSSLYLDEYQIIPNQTSDLERRILAAHGISVDSTSSVSISNTTLETTFIDTNYFVYCVCLENSKDVRTHFGNGLQEIFDFKSFIKGLTALLEQKSIFIQDMGPCVYLPRREQNFDTSNLSNKGKNFVLHKPYFVKDERYSYQKEYRVLWKYVPDKEIEDPLMIQDLKNLEKYYKTKIVPVHKKQNKKNRNRR